MERYIKRYPTKWQNQYTEEFKRSVCEEYKHSTLTRRQLEKKYRIGNSRLTHWLLALGYSIKRPPLVSLLSMPKPINSDTEKDVLQLKKELEDAKILAETYKRMIEIAEEQLKIELQKR